jgi:hypothetical protein
MFLSGWESLAEGQNQTLPWTWRRAPTVSPGQVKWHTKQTVPMEKRRAMKLSHSPIELAQGKGNQPPMEKITKKKKK